MGEVEILIIVLTTFNLLLVVYQFWERRRRHRLAQRIYTKWTRAYPKVVEVSAKMTAESIEKQKGHLEGFSDTIEIEAEKVADESRMIR